MLLYFWRVGSEPIPHGVILYGGEAILSAATTVSLVVLSEDGQRGQLSRLRYDGRLLQAEPMPPERADHDPHEEVTTFSWAVETLGVGTYQATVLSAGRAWSKWFQIDLAPAGPVLVWLTDERDEAEELFLDAWIGEQG